MKPDQTFEDESTVDLQRVEDALRENEERYRTLFDLAPSPFILVMSQA